MKHKSKLKKYRLFFALALINILIIILLPEFGRKTIALTYDNAIVMLTVIPPIFILLGLLDVWVKRETMVKFMGENSGFIGVAIAFFIGSAAAGPLYAAFPVALILLKKGSKLSNVLIMLGAWSTTKIPMLLFETSSMGLKFTLIRLVLNLFGIAAISFFTEKLLKKDEIKTIYENAQILE